MFSLVYENDFPPGSVAESHLTTRKKRAEKLKRPCSRTDVLSSQYSETLHFSALRTRQELLADTAALARVITSIGGVEALAESAGAIKDVGRWWP